MSSNIVGRHWQPVFRHHFATQPTGPRTGYVAQGFQSVNIPERGLTVGLQSDYVLIWSE